MAQYVSLISFDLPQLYLWNKFDDFISFSYIETELDETDAYFSMFSQP